VQQSVAGAPSFLGDPAAACDIRGYVMVYGTTSSGSQTWQFDGATWTQCFPANNAPPLGAPMMALDLWRGRLVLVANWPALETCEWDGTDWHYLNPVHRPSSRMAFGLAFDPSAGKVTLYGGAVFGSPVVYSNETWQWDGVDWTLLPATANAAANMGMCEDLVRGRIVMFGGNNHGVALGTTWEWDGATWTMRLPSTSPSPMYFAKMASDPASGQPLMLGSGNALNPGTPGTWTLSATSASFYEFGTGCGGTAGVPRLNAAAPWSGGPWPLQLDSLPPGSLAMLAIGTSASQWNGQPLPLPLAPLGMPGCQLLVAPMVLLGAGTSAGACSWQLGIPANLRCTLYCQGMALDAAANAAGAVLSNGGQAVLAGR
jgi:hypothetical protein